LDTDEHGDDTDLEYDYNHRRNYNANNHLSTREGSNIDKEYDDERYNFDFSETKSGFTKYAWFGLIFNQQFCLSTSVVGMIVLLIGLAILAFTVEVQHFGDDTVVPIPPSNLAGLCLTDRDACVSACVPGSCCFMHLASHPNSCFEKNTDRCALYEPCDTLLLINDEHATDQDASKLIYSSTSIVPDPPGNLPSICSMFAGTPGTMDAIVRNPTECRSACLTASCCLEPGPNLNCASNPLNEQSCPIYKKYCTHLSPPMLDLSDWDGTIPPPPHNLRDICSRENILNTEGEMECEQACDVGLCCVGMGNQVDCALLPPMQKAPICMAYKRHCATVWPSEVYTNEKDLVPRPLEQWCSVIDSEKKSRVCADVCDHVKCCWEDGPSNCRSFNGANCDSYSFCLDYKEALEEDSSADLAPPIIPEKDIADHCSLLSTVDPEVLQDCKSMCAAGGCCLYPPSHESASDGVNDCFLEYGDICSLYQPCLDLPYDGWSTHVISKSPLEYVCESSDGLSFDEGRQICLDACSAGSCCYDDDLSKNCFADNEQNCWLYESCRENRIVPPAPADLTDKCSFKHGEEIGKAECIKACQPSACCWEGRAVDEDGNIEQGLCYYSNEATCSTYKPSCVIVFPYLGYGMGWQAESGLLPVIEACSSHNLVTDEGVSRCREECEPSWCCVAEGPLSCRDKYPHFCQQYEPICGPLLRLGMLDEDEYYQQGEENIQTICSMKNVVTLKGKARCEAECASASCCYVSVGADGSDRKKYSCREEKAEWCNKMTACDVLIELTALTSNTEDGFEIDEHTVLVPYAPSNIASVCAKDKVSTFTGRRECEDSCYPSECCYEEGGSGSCREANQGACDSYHPWCDGLVA